MYCAVITQDGQKKIGFAECSDERPGGNVSQKIASKGKGDGMKLVERIDL